jgi:hypothetical protein
MIAKNPDNDGVYRLSAKCITIHGLAAGSAPKNQVASAAHSRAVVAVRTSAAPVLGQVAHSVAARRLE